MKRLFVTLFILASISVGSQENIFLKRDFWKTNPTIATINKHIADGNDIAQLNLNAFDGVVYALLEKVDNKTIKYLLSKKGNGLNKITHDGRTYVFWAAYKNNLEIMKYLLSNGAKTDVVDTHGYTYMNFAASTGQTNPTLYDLCLEYGANPKTEKDHNGANALLLLASSLKDTFLIDYFVAKGVDINSTDNHGNGLFNYAARTSNKTILEYAIKKGLPHKSLNSESGNAMIFASRGSRNVTNGLQDYQYLENLGVNPNVVTKDGVTPLHGIARKSKELEVYSYFLSKGVDVNQQDDKGRTALTNALTRNSLDVVNFLIKNGADVQVKDKKGNNLVYYLIQSYRSNRFAEFQQKVTVLAKNGLNISQHQKDGNSLYHLALGSNDMNLLKWAQDQKINVNAKNQEGLTVLQQAAMTAKNAMMLKYLLSIGADKTVKTDFDESVYDLASENELLQKNNIDIQFLK